MKMNLLKYIFVTLVAVGCNTSKNLTPDVLVYRSISSDTGSYSELKLNTEKTFTYRSSIGLITAESKGIWSDEGNKIVLKSDSVFQNGFLMVKEIEVIDSNDEVKIKLVDNKSKEPIAFAEISDGKGNKLITDDRGIVVFESIEINSLDVEFLGETYKWNFSSKPKGEIIITLVEKDLRKVYFNDEAWVRSSNKLKASNGKIFELMN